MSTDALRAVMALALAGVAGGAALAQTPPVPAKSFFEPFDRIDTKRWYISDGWVNGASQGCTWARSNLAVQSGILKMRLTKAPNKLRGYKCAEIRTWGRYGYGLYEARIRSAAGSGLNTAMFTYSGKPLTPVHDEVDIELLGRSSSRAQYNIFTNGRGGRESSEAVGGDASVHFHLYAFEWTPLGVRWFIDGKLIRTENGTPLPQTPGQLFLTLWVGAKPVDSWLGRFTDPRPVITSEVDWIAYTAPGDSCMFPLSLSCKR